MIQTRNIPLERDISQYKNNYRALKDRSHLLVGFWGSKQLLTQQPDKAQMQTIHVPAGQRAEVILADGTHVWLNSRSTLKFSEQFSANTRNVELDGEGYFSVQHNEKVHLPCKLQSIQSKYWGLNLM